MAGRGKLAKDYEKRREGEDHGSEKGEVPVQQEIKGNGETEA